MTQLKCTTERWLLSAEAVLDINFTSFENVAFIKVFKCITGLKGRGAKHMLKVKTTVLLTTSVKK